MTSQHPPAQNRSDILIMNEGLPTGSLFVWTETVHNAGGDRSTMTMPDQQSSNDHYADARKRMVQHDLADRDITDPRILDAMRRVPRHEFVPAELRAQSYADTALPIGADQTIS